MKKIILGLLAVVAATSSVSAANVDIAAVLRAAGIDEATIQIILAAQNAQNNATQASTTTTVTKKKTYVYTRLLKIGKRGNDVKELQKCLNRLGNNTGVADGIFGRNTAAGVKSFQREHGLLVDGIIGPQTGPEFEKACEIDVPVQTTTTPVVVTIPTTTTTPVVEEPKEEEKNNEEKEEEVKGDKLVVSGVASDDMIVGKNQTVVFAKLKLKAGDEDVEVKKVYVKYKGTADADVIKDVVLLDSAMLEIDTDSLDSDDEAVLKADLEIKDGEEKVVYVAARTADSFTAEGLTGSLKVTEITTDGADVEGLPIEGANHTFNAGVTTDNFTVKVENESGSVKVGEEDVKVTTVNIEAGDDNQTVKSIKLVRTASADKAGDDDLDNVYIKVRGKKYKAEQDDDEYTFDFGDGILLEDDGDDEDFVVYVDVEDGAGSKFKFDVEDIVVVDEDGVLLSADTAGPWTDTEEFEIELSEITISKTTDVQSDKVAAGKDGVELASFKTEVTGKDVEGDLKITVVASNVDVENGDGTANDPIVVDLKDIDLDNVAIYTKDGDRVSDKEDTSFSITPADGEDDQVTYEITFDDVKFEASEDAIDFVIKADINEDAPDGVKYSVTKIKYTSIEDEDGEDIADVEETISSPAEIEVEGAVIEVSLKEADDTDLNKDSDDVEVAQIKLDASNSGDDIKITKIKLAIEVDDADASGTDNDDLRDCELYDGDKSVSDKEDAGSTVTFDNLDIVVKQDTEKTLSVRCDLNDDFTNGDKVKVTADSFDAEGVNTDTDLDDSFTGDVEATVTTGEVTLTVSTDDANDDKVVRDNDDDVVLGVFEFKAKKAELDIDDVTFEFDGDISSIIDGKVEIFIDGDSEGSEDLESDGKSVVFENLSKRVDKDQTVEIKFVADMDNSGTITPKKVTVTTEDNGPTADVDSAHPVVDVVPAIPVITQIDTDTNSLETKDDVVLFAYKVKAEGGDIVLGNTVFEVTDNTNVNLKNIRVKVYDNSSMSGTEEFKDTHADVDAGNPFAWDVDLSSITVDENDTYYVYLIADITATDDTRVLRAQISDKTYAADTEGMKFKDIDDETANDQELDAEKVLEDDMKALLKKD